MKLAYHNKAQLLDQGGNPIANRWSIEPSKTVSFLPGDIDVVDRKANDKVTDRSEWGAFYKGRWADIPSMHAEVLHECKLIPAADPTVVTMRPTGSIKCVLKCDFTVLKDKVAKRV